MTPQSKPNTDDLRIREIKELVPPAHVFREYPVSNRAAQTTYAARQAIHRILHGADDRLLVVIGPCSIHDYDAALEYARRLAKEAERHAEDLVILMRVYFEKPRTTVGWKGFINDPDLDESHQINKGLRAARHLLRDLAALGLPVGTEFLDMTVPQFIADFVSWGAIGARTVESQPHRELASGLSMPIGFKNNTDGHVQSAIDAILAASSPHWFSSNTKHGVAAHFKSTGNPDCHVILRGGSKTGPNFDPMSVRATANALSRAGLNEHVMVDCSHGNSGKDPARQAEVASSVARQIREGSPYILGVMIESNLVGGRQDIGRRELVYGQSVTDACLSFEDSIPLLDELAESVSSRHPVEAHR